MQASNIHYLLHEVFNQTKELFLVLVIATNQNELELFLSYAFVINNLIVDNFCHIMSQFLTTLGIEINGVPGNFQKDPEYPRDFAFFVQICQRIKKQEDPGKDLRNQWGGNLCTPPFGPIAN